MQPLNWLKRLARDQGGNALVICAAAMPLIIGAAGIGVDTIQSSVARRQLQRAADSAALAGAFAKSQDRDPRIAAEHDLSLNNDMVLTGGPVIENAPSSGAFSSDANAVRVVLTAQRTVPFMSFFTNSPMTVQVEATATKVTASPFCVLALENTTTTGVTFSGSGTIALGCGVSTNSTSTQAVVATGSAMVTASPISAVGVVPSSSNYTAGSELRSYITPQIDPFADLPIPDIPPDCHTTPYVVEANAPAPTPVPSSTGVYCYAGMALRGPVVLPSGTYIVNGGTKRVTVGLELKSQAVVTCNGCTFILTGKDAATNPGQIAQLEIEGGATFVLTAPASGPYTGVAMFQDRRSPLGETRFAGNSMSVVQGALYFPSRQLTFTGTSGMLTQCLQLVARRVLLTGNVNISNNCFADSGSRAFDGTFIRLVA